MAENTHPSSGLGSLAQSARGKHLKQARGIMLFVGILTILFNGFLYFNVEKEARDAVQAEIRKLGPGAIVDQAQVRKVEETAVKFGRIIYGGTILLGVVFGVLGIMVYQYPVPATATALVLYIASMVIFALLAGPQTLVQGIIIKIIVIVALFKSLQAAIAYQKEQQAMAAAEEPIA